jgi:hypothetical protein
VAERQQIQESQRLERPRVLPVLHHLAFDRDDVREHVAMAMTTPFGVGGCAGGEDDLDDVVAGDARRRHRTVGAPVEIGQRPHRSAIDRVARRHTRDVVADQQDARLDEPSARDTRSRQTTDSRSEPQ